MSRGAILQYPKNREDFFSDMFLQSGIQASFLGLTMTLLQNQFALKMEIHSVTNFGQVCGFLFGTLILTHMTIHGTTYMDSKQLRTSLSQVLFEVTLSPTLPFFFEPSPFCEPSTVTSISGRQVWRGSNCVLPFQVALRDVAAPESDHVQEFNFFLQRIIYEYVPLPCWLLVVWHVSLGKLC